MDPTVAYVLVSLMGLLVLYFAWQNVRAYQKNPSGWVRRYMGESVGDLLFRG